MAEPSLLPPGQEPFTPNLRAPQPPAREETYKDFNMDEVRPWVAGIESDVTEELRTRLGREPSVEEVNEGAQAYAAIKEDEDYAFYKRLVISEPSQARQAVDRFGDRIGEGLSNAGEAVKSALTERTASLRTEDSSLPSIDINLGPLSGAASVAQDALGLNQQIGPSFNGQIPDSFSVTPPDFGGTYHFGAEQLADLIETGGPIVGEAFALAKSATPLGFISKIMAVNVGTELGAESLRVANRAASDLPNSALNFADPGNVARHFAKVASGGALLGAADVALNSSMLATRRKAYRLTLGLGTPASDEKMARMRFLGVDPSLAQVSTGAVQAIASSLQVYPLTARRSINQARNTVASFTRTLSDDVGNLANHVLSGTHLHDKSAQYFRIHDEYFQHVREAGGNSYNAAKDMVSDATTKLGLDQVHVPHSTVKQEIEDIVAKATAGMPLVGTPDKFGHRRLARETITESPDFQTLQDVMDLDDKVDIVEYARLRNELNGITKRLQGDNDLNAAVYETVASKMHGAMDNMVAPDAVKLGWKAADQKWLDMHALLSESTWRHFKAANSKFGRKNKTHARSSKSTEIVLQDTFGDPKITPGIVDTLHSTAKSAGADDYYKGAVEAHFKRSYEKAIDTPTSGPLAGLETVNFARLEKAWGLNEPSGVKWRAHARMIETAGGDPSAMAEWIKQAKLAFPNGIPNPSATAARRTGIAGLGSAVRFATGVGAVQTKHNMGVGATSSVLNALGGLIGLVGVGELFFNPTVLRKMTRVMTGNISEQGAYRTMFNIAGSVAVTRNFQQFLQGAGIDPRVDPKVIDRQARTDRLRAVTLDNLRLSPFDRDPLLPDPDKQPQIGPRPPSSYEIPKPAPRNRAI